MPKTILLLNRRRKKQQLFRSNWSWNSEIWMGDNDKCCWQKIYSGHTRLSHVRVYLPQMLVIHVSDDISAVEDRHTTCCVCLLKLACTIIVHCIFYTELHFTLYYIVHSNALHNVLHCTLYSVLHCTDCYSWLQKGTVSFPFTQYNRSHIYLCQSIVRV